MIKYKWFRSLFRRRVIYILIIALQLLFLLSFIIMGSHKYMWMNYALQAVSFFVALYIINKHDKSGYKLLWGFLILSFPVLGGLVYVLFNFQTSTAKFSKRMELIEKNSKSLFTLTGNHLNEVCNKVPEHKHQIKYLQEFAGFPIYKNTTTEYLSPGEKKYKRLVQELEKAEKYIFLEYFIIQEGIMWNTILEILSVKAVQGVEVRVMYDDVGCFFLLPRDYPQYLKSLGIQCSVFNPFRPFLSAKQNNRDHRKIAVIDGKVAFTGGINLADEYINVKLKHGHWKDASVVLEGEAAWSFTLMFLQMWALNSGEFEYFEKYYPWTEKSCPIKNTTDNYAQPYTDSPMDNENVGEHVYLQIINNAKDYVYINTPYLIIDDTLISSLSMAAKSGVDVRIVTPRHGDKWFVHTTTRSYYRELVKSGVKIYEYTDGFIHSKTFVSDDTTATVGTTNLDYRSLYLHFECGVCMYNTAAVTEVRDDFIKTLDGCCQITEEDMKGSAVNRFIQDLLRLFAPLM